MPQRPDFDADQMEGHHQSVQKGQPGGHSERTGHIGQISRVVMPYAPGLRVVRGTLSSWRLDAQRCPESLFRYGSKRSARSHRYPAWLAVIVALLCVLDEVPQRPPLHPFAF